MVDNNVVLWESFGLVTQGIQILYSCNNGKIKKVQWRMIQKQNVFSKFRSAGWRIYTRSFNHVYTYSLPKARVCKYIKEKAFEIYRYTDKICMNVCMTTHNASDHDMPALMTM